MGNKTVIIGGVAAGATAAARLRRRDESAEIIIFEKGNYISYANCGLPYYIGDVIKNREALILQTPKAMELKYNIDVRVSHEVTNLDPAKKQLEVKNLITGEVSIETYDQLVIATGSSPVRPMIPGIESDNIFTIWTVPDTDGIKKFIQEKKPRTATVIGGGFIGLEMAENLHQQGLQVSVIEMQDQVMAPLDKEMAGLLQKEMQNKNINLILEDGVKAFHQEESLTRIELTSGRVIDAELIILSIGVRPNSGLAKRAGLQLNEKGGIIVNDYLQTSELDIYAAGDVIEVNNYVNQSPTMIPLAGPANKQARIVADNIAGDKKKYKGTLGSSIVKVFELDAACVGMNEKQLRAKGMIKHKDYHVAFIVQKSHAGYYPGASMLTMKLLFDQAGIIFGAQMIGKEGVDKRIDTIATTMRLHGTIHDLAELELAYAPPFSSAKDPVNMLGFVAENILDGLVSFIEKEELDALFMDPSKQHAYVVLNVTEERERVQFAIPGSYHIPLGQLRERIDELDRQKWIIPYCAIGVRSYMAARILSQNGFEHVSVLAGGTSFYR